MTHCKDVMIRVYDKLRTQFPNSNHSKNTQDLEIEMKNWGFKPKHLRNEQYLSFPTWTSQEEKCVQQENKRTRI